ncbi:aspartate aminotransferase family protein [Salinarimonas rosea]|uniref:aspartate aminotransferase family protein n=1 Tax=Salinarimonas rosea TaxID=552063 RepID=UPI000A071DA5|nr:aminotransferase class III-fold pyridoxal phosphate-dependent enzyme [Salinarimonas rosea]
MPYALQQSKSYNDRLKKVVPGGVHYSFRIPWESKQIHFARARGARAWDLDGNEYLDLFGKFGANILGHGHPGYVAALTDALGAVTATTLGSSEAQAAERICALVPCAEMVRFGLSGTDAVENAIRLARAHTGKQRFVRFARHYHGNADNLLGGGVGEPSFPVPIETAGDLYDTEGKARDIAQQQSFLMPWNDLPALDAVIRAHGHEIAALIMEPFCVNGGGTTPVPGYLEGARRLCDAHGIVLVFDEVITGFRTSLAGAQGVLRVTPDLCTLGKALGGGALPVSAVAGQREIMRLYADRRVVHGGTFNGYPLGMAAVLATLEILSAEAGAPLERMHRTMRVLERRFLAAAERHGLDFRTSDIDGLTIVHPRIADDGGDDPGARRRADLVTKLTGEALAENGILVSNMNRMYGSIALEDRDVAFFEERVDAALGAVAAFVSRLRR